MSIKLKLTDTEEKGYIKYFLTESFAGCKLYPAVFTASYLVRVCDLNILDC